MALSRFAGTVLTCLTLGASAQAAAPPARGTAGPSCRDGGSLFRAATVACRQLAERGVFCQPLEETRSELFRGVGYYTLEVKVGPGEYDAIGLHRVVAERRPGQAKAAKQAVFMIHGALFGFEPAFLGLTLYAEPSQDSLPTFLARSGVDVWGISYRWSRLTAGLPDQSFMADWGMDASVSDARVGLRIARVARELAGHGSRRLHVLGWSLGAWTTMALANAEAAEPPRWRDVAGVIPVEGTFKADPAEVAYIRWFCDDAAYFQGELDAGHFGADRSFFQLYGQLALDSPDEESAILPGLGLINAQAAMGFGAWPQGGPGNEWYHLHAGTFDEQPETLVPTGFVYTDPVLSFVAVTKTTAFDPVRLIVDMNVVTCDAPDVPWDDHLAEVRVPVLFVGAGGAWGPLMEHQAGLLGSRDVTTLIVREQPPEQAWLDVGHGDIFWASASRDLFWKPILAWIREH